jgi:hypothetical protein
MIGQSGPLVQRSEGNETQSFRSYLDAPPGMSLQRLSLLSKCLANQRVFMTQAKSTFSPQLIRAAPNHSPLLVQYQQCQSRRNMRANGPAYQPKQHSKVKTIHEELRGQDADWPKVTLKDGVFELFTIILFRHKTVVDRFRHRFCFLKENDEEGLHFVFHYRIYNI